MTMRRWALLLPLAAAALIAAGCGGDDANGSGTAMASDEKTASGEMTGDGGEMKAEASAMAGGARIKVVDSKYGRVVADRKGEALYLFEKESSKRSKCYGECASAWPPVLTKGLPRAAGGAKQSLVGTTRRRNGKLQATYAGHPLYYYVADSPGTILCQDVEEFGGLWLVLRPSGRPVS
jgi:predicted lipoprotein with Yx(FWY)xxD motif